LGGYEYEKLKASFGVLLAGRVDHAGNRHSTGCCGKSENNHNSLGTQIVTSRLDLVNSLYGTSLKTIYTDLKDENGEPEGTRVEIHIPILT